MVEPYEALIQLFVIFGEIRMEIDSKALAKEIDKEFRTMRFHPMIEETEFAIFEANNIQVQIVLTKDESRHCSEIVKGIVDS